MRNYITLSPAYGRDYKSKKAAIADFDAGKDFEHHSMTMGGKYCSKSDFGPGDTLNIRYKGMTLIAVVNM